MLFRLGADQARVLIRLGAVQARVLIRLGADQARMLIRLGADQARCGQNNAKLELTKSEHASLRLAL